MAEAIYKNVSKERKLTAVAAVAAGEIWQLPDGRAAVQQCATGVSAGDPATFYTKGMWTVAKTATMVILDGMPVFWDVSASKCHYKKVNDKDFFLGTAVGDAASAATTMDVNINVQPVWDIDFNRDGLLSVPTGTQAVGAFGYPKTFGGARSLALTATNEAQCVDMLTVDRFDKGANAIARFIFRLGTNGSTSDVDINFGIANGTSTSDADAITEHVLLHIDGGTLTILAQSKDGTTTNAAATTGVSATAAAAVADRVELWIDTRNPADVGLYVNSARVISGTAFRIDGATGPFGLLAHVEKISGTATAGPIYVDAMQAHYAEQ